MHDTHASGFKRPTSVQSNQPANQLAVYTTVEHCTQSDTCLVLLLDVSYNTDGTKAGNNTQPRSNRNSNTQLASVSIATLSLPLVQQNADASATVQQSRMTCVMSPHSPIEDALHVYTKADFAGQNSSVSDGVYHVCS